MLVYAAEKLIFRKGLGKRSFIGTGGSIGSIGSRAVQELPIRIVSDQYPRNLQRSKLPIFLRFRFEIVLAFW